MNDFLTKYYEEARNQYNKALAELKAAGFAEFTAEYSGSGDSGGIDSVEYKLVGEKMLIEATREENNWVKGEGWKPTTRPATERDIIEDFCYAWLEQNHPGWEINDGQEGTISFDGERITHDGRSFYTETTELEEEFYV